VCSKAKISLRKRESGKNRSLSDARPERTHRAAIPLKLPKTAVGRLQQEAAKRGLPVATFASMLLKIIAQDNLYDAVLDKPKARKRGHRQGSS